MSDSQYSPAVLSDPRPDSTAGLFRARVSRRRTGPVRAGAGGVVASRAVQDPKLEIQMLHDRVMVRGRRAAASGAAAPGIVIPATAEVAEASGLG